MTMFPIKCLIEAIEDDQMCPQCCKSGSSVVVSDSYAIVAGQTPLNQLTETVLAALGLQHLSYGSKATLQLKNWKPLSFDQITEDQDTEIENILKDVSNHLTLRILTKQPSTIIRNGMNDLKDRLLRAILQKVPNILTEAQQSQWKEFLSQLAFTDAALATSMDPCLSACSQNVLKSSPPWLDDSAPKNGYQGSESGNTGPVDLRAPISMNHEAENCDGAKMNGAESVTRFSPLLEVPKLERWFRENANPSRQKLQHYLTALNATNFRRHNAKITYQQICNWFINARATARKRNPRIPASSHTQKPIDWVRLKAIQAQHCVNQNGTPWSNKSAPKNKSKKSFDPNNNILINNTSLGASNEISQHKSPSCSQPTADVVESQNFDEQVQNGPALNVTLFQLHENYAASPPKNIVQLSLTPSTNFGALEIDEKAHSSSSYSSSHENTDLLKDIVKFESLINGSCTEMLVNGYGEHEKMHDTLASSSGGSPAPPSDYVHNSVSPNSVLNRSSMTCTTAQMNRSRLMFDPLSELPMLEKWFEENPHPSWVQIDQITDALNTVPYRQTYPRVSSHNVKIWFKNRRAKCKRSLTLTENANTLVGKEECK